MAGKILNTFFVRDGHIVQLDEILSQNMSPVEPPGPSPVPPVPPEPEPPVPPEPVPPGTVVGTNVAGNYVRLAVGVPPTVLVVG